MDDRTQSPPDVRRARLPMPAALAIIIAVGLLARAALLLATPAYSFFWDHVDFMAWADYAATHGPFRLYELDNRRSFLHARWYDPAGGGWNQGPIGVPTSCNYPPLSCGVFWLQGRLWHALDSNELSSPIPTEVRQRLDLREDTVRSRVANTLTARVVGAAPSLLADVLLACGVAMLTRAAAGRPNPARELAAFGLTFLAPPIILDSSFWCQTDAWVSAAMVWSTCLLMTGRAATGGVIYGLALMTKAQAILLAPVTLFVLLAHGLAAGRAANALRTALSMALATAMTAALIAAPFSLVSGMQGEPWRWLDRSYVGPIVHAYPQTTMNAYNVWWLMGLMAEGADALDPTALVAGLSRDAWGRLALATAAALTVLICWRWRPAAVAPCAFLVLFAAFLLPTRVHERYLYYCIPFLVAAAIDVRAWRPALAVLLIIGTFEMTWFLWNSPAVNPELIVWLSGGLAIAAVATFVYCIGTLFTAPVRRAEAA
jgi:hypothetical protein